MKCIPKTYYNSLGSGRIMDSPILFANQIYLADYVAVLFEISDWNS